MPRYILRSDPPRSSDETFRAYDLLTRRLLSARGIEHADAAERFFVRAYDEGLHDPFLLNDMDRATERLAVARARQETIAVFSDYDCDGIPGGAMLSEFLRTVSFSRVITYIPHRHHEGYGLSVEAVRELHTQGVTLLITVDCGISNGEEIAYAHTLGIDVIVTDHHEPGEALPAAYAVINPKRADSTYPFAGLCGAGVAFKLVAGLLRTLSKDASFVWTIGKEKWLLDLVGLATIADMVPLQDENRLLAHYGLMVLRKTRRPGLRHLFRTLGMVSENVTEDDIGFMIAPRINAASRMGSPHDAFLLLTTQDDGEAGAYARTLEAHNNERKGVVASMVKAVKHRLSLRSSLDPVIVVGDPSWRPSLVGLAATALAETYARPVFLWGRDGNNVIKGSCRSHGNASVIALMERVSDAFLSFGGHHASGGFSVKEECIHTLPERLSDIVRAHQDADRENSVYVDAVLTLEEVTPALLATLQRFAPFGVGNEKPIFLFRGVIPHRVEKFGKQKAHTKLTFTRKEGTLSVIGFFRVPEAYLETPRTGSACDVLAHVEESMFNGKREVRLRIVDIVPGNTVARDEGDREEV